MRCAELFEECEMPFSSDNQAWVRDEIQRALAKALKEIKPPNGLRKLLFVCREWGVLAANVTVILTLLIFALTQWSAANAHLAHDAVFQQKTEDRLTSVEKSLLALQISRAAESPAKNSSQSEAKQALAQAKKAQILLPKSVIQDAGKGFIAASKENLNAWPVALEFAAYRTTLNSSPVTSDYLAQKVSDIFDLQPYVVPGKAPTFSTFSAMPIDRAARYDIISAPLPNRKFGPMWLIAEGGEPILDGEHIRRVIFRDAVIHYAGGPVILENVVFVNCTFIFDNVPNGRGLGNQILTASDISWRPEG